MADLDGDGRDELLVVRRWQTAWTTGGKIVEKLWILFITVGNGGRVENPMTDSRGYVISVQ